LNRSCGHGSINLVERERRHRGAETTPARRTTRPPEPSLASAIGNLRMSRYYRALARAPDPPAPVIAPEPGKEAPKEDLAKATIKQAVGAGAPNKDADVAVVKKLLAAAGYEDPNLEVAIQRFQRVVVGVAPSKADGRVDPNGATFKTLKAAATTPGGVSTGGRTKKDFWADDDWENLLAKGDAALHFKRKGAYEVTDTDKDKPTLDDKQKAVLAKINTNRAALPDLFEAKHKGRQGYSLGDSRPGTEDATPTAVTNEADADRKKMKALIWDELGSEAALEGVQTYDDQGWGWGKGWSAKGSMTGVMENLFALDPAAEKLLFEAGIALSTAGGGTFKVVNGDTGAIEYGQNAIELMRVSPKLLSIFVTLGRDAAHKQHSTDAQWQEMEKKAGNVPAYASKWLASNSDTIRLIVHMSHWQPASGWRSHDYSGTGGDMFKVLKQFCRHAAAPQPNGAWVVPPNLALGEADKRLDHYAKGKGKAALTSNAKIITVTPAQMAAKPAAAQPPAPGQPVQGAPAPAKPEAEPKPPDVSGHVLIPITKNWGQTDKNQFYDLGAI
jgi:hypothetical protein